MKHFKTIAPVIPAFLFFGWLTRKLWFIQDDAYISFRYVANLLNGHGLVYNIGERIEGFTNFGWVIYTALIGALGADYILWSRITGLLCGMGIILLTFLMARHLFEDTDPWLSLLPAYLVAVNPALAYWSPAGLETAAFALTVLSSLYCYVTRSRWLVLPVVLAVWIRPEGAFVAGLLMLVEAITERRLPIYTGRMVGLAFILSLPFAAFKLLYYGSILPNPFYAKTGWHWDYLTSGLEYAGKFFADMGFVGIGVLVPLIFWKRLSGSLRTVWLFTVFYTVYIILIGGDVLKVYRFFIPIIACFGVLIALSVRCIVSGLVRKTRYLVYFLAAVPLLALTLRQPWDHVTTYNSTEKLFLQKMQFMAQRMLESDSTDFSVAVATIGIFGYELLGHDVIDLVGLTDSTIARHSEPPIKGMTTTWKEQKHNSKYLLTRAPDYIVFSTGVKPSAPAERALLLFPEFLNSYRTVGWFYKPSQTNTGTIVPAFKKVREVKGSFVPTYPVEYVQHYKLGLDYYVAGDQQRAVREFSQALKVSPKPYNPYVIYQKGFSHMLAGEHETAVKLFDLVLAQDSMVFEAHKDLYFYSAVSGDTARANLHLRWLKKLVPWYVPKIMEDAARTKAKINP